MKEYRKKRYLFYDFMFACSILLGVTIIVTPFITYNIPVMALPGLGLTIATTAYLHSSLSYVLLADDSFVIRHKSNNRKETVYMFSEIDAVIIEYSFLEGCIEYSFLEGCKIGIKQGYITKDYTVLLVGKKEADTLKNDLVKRGINVLS